MFAVASGLGSCSRFWDRGAAGAGPRRLVRRVLAGDLDSSQIKGVLLRRPVAFFSPAIQYVKTGREQRAEMLGRSGTFQTNLFNMIAFILFALVLWVVRARFSTSRGD